MKKGYHFDLHIHSKYSFDSIQSIEAVIRQAEKAGLDGIAITDHNTMRGVEKSKKIKTSLTIIPGEEVETERGDIIGLFLKREIKSREFSSVVKEIKSQSGVVVLPHPYKVPVDKGFVKYVDIVEVFNSLLKPKENMRAKALALELKKPMICGSDAHFAKDIGNATTVIYSESKNLSDIKEALLQGKIRIIGKYSSKKSRIKSQIIKAIKTKDVKLVFRLVLRIPKKILGGKK